MGRFLNYTLLASVPTFTAIYYTQKTQIYTGPYLEKNPFDESKYSLAQRLKYKILGNNDNVIHSKSFKLTNPNGNTPSFDHYEQTLDKETTAKVLAKHKTNEEILKLIEKGYFKGPTLWFHQYALSAYFQFKSPFNRIAGFTAWEPELKKLDVSKLPKTAIFDFPLLPENKDLKYVWKASAVEKEKGLLPLNTVVYGLFDVIDYGKRTNGGYYDVSFGSDLLPATMIHRFEYEIVENQKHEQNLVFRLTNVSQFTAPTKNIFTDETGGLHEFMTRTIVQDIIREVRNSVN